MVKFFKLNRNETKNGSFNIKHTFTERFQLPIAHAFTADTETYYPTQDITRYIVMSSTQTKTLFIFAVLFYDLRL